MSYDKDFVAAKNVASLAARLCQAVVSAVLQKELDSYSFSLVDEEDSRDLCKEDEKETLQRIMELVNETLASDGTY
ncbi:hypothetical protein HAX54_021685, partial [Datura stramonium]|nr:hypothetical protein [Datura stramonium]